MVDIAKNFAESGLNFDEISYLSGIPVARIIQISNGEDFSLEELNLLAKALNISLLDFLDKPEVQKKAELLFRRSVSMSSEKSPNTTINRISSYISNASEIANESNKSISWLNEFQAKNFSYESAEYNADKFRSLFFKNDFVSPFHNLPQICTELLNSYVFVVSEKEIDGASAIIDGHIYIFLANRSFKPRMLFTLAHELGHIVAGHHHKEDVVSFDRYNEIGGSTRGKSPLEKFADAFASSLLMPPKGVAVALKKIKELIKAGTAVIGDIELLYLSRIFAVSFETAALRCESLQLLPRGGGRALYERIKDIYGSPEKRAEELGLPPRAPIHFQPVPSALIENAMRQIHYGKLSIGAAANMLNITIPELYLVNAQNHGLRH